MLPRNISTLLEKKTVASCTLPLSCPLRHYLWHRPDLCPHKGWMQPAHKKTAFAIFPISTLTYIDNVFRYTILILSSCTCTLLGTYKGQSALSLSLSFFFFWTSEKCLKKMDRDTLLMGEFLSSINNWATLLIRNAARGFILPVFLVSSFSLLLTSKLRGVTITSCFQSL